MSKYNAIPVDMDGIHFDSKSEYRRYTELLLLQKAGEIADLVCHPRYVIWEGKDAKGKRQQIEYEGDFQYYETKTIVCEDVKGVMTPVFRLKAKMFKCAYPEIEFRVLEAK